MYRITLYEHGAYPNGGQVLLDTSSGTNLGIISSSTEEQLNEAGSYTYGIVPSSPLYNMTDPLNYYVSVEENGEETFYGRILSVQKNPITAIKQVTCEGALAFLLDAEMPIDKDGTEYTTAQYFALCIQEYNSQIGNDPARAMSVGTIDITGSSESSVYKNGSYTQIQSVIKSQLVDKYDGFLHVRRTSGGQHVIDWVEQVGGTDPQPVRVTQNVIDQTTTDSGEDIFTIMRPVGKDGVSPGLMTVSQDMLNRYGRIIRTVSFPDEETAEGVAAKANAYIVKLRDRLTLSGDISFIDFNYLDGTKPRVRIGDVFTSIVGYEGTKLTAGSLSRDHLAPQNDKLSLKNDKDLMSSAVASGANSATTAVGSGGGRGFSGGGSFRYKFIHETDKDLALAARNIEISAEEKIAINAKQIEVNAESIQKNAADILAENEKWTEFEGTTFYQNKEHITAVAGRYTIDQYGNVYLKDGASFSISKNGVLTNVGTAIEHQGQSIDNLQNWKTTYEGTAIYQNREHIAQVAGEYLLEEYVDDDGIKKKRLIISNGTQLYQNRNGGRFALYDDKNLTAGVMFSKMNNGQTSTGLLGDKVYVGSAKDQLDDWVKETDDGLVAVKARIKTLETDYLKTADLSAGIASIEDVNVKKIHSNAGSAIFHTVSASNVLNVGGVNCSYLPNAIRTLRIRRSGNTYYLDKTTYADTEWQEVGNFSRATTLSGGWSSGRYTVTADPQGNKQYTDIVQGATSWNGNVATVSVDAYDNGQTQYQRGTGRNISVNATARYNAGYTAGQNGVYVSEWTGTDIGGSDESNSNPITAKLSNSGSYSKTIYMGIGSWGSGKCGVTTRMDNSDGIVINRVYVSAPGVTGLRAVKTGNQQIIYGKVGGSSEKNLGTISIPS